MQERKTIDYFNQLFDEFHRNFELTKERQGEEDIHELRLAVKKLKVMLALLEFATDKSFLKAPHYQIFKPVFKKAGEFREAQINMNLITNENTVSFLAYTEKLQQRQQIICVELLNLMQDFDFNLLEELNSNLFEVVHNFSDEEILKASSGFIKNKWEKISNLMDYIEDGEKLHKIRIHLRAIHELIVLINFIGPSPEMQQLQIDIKALNNLLGEWHDYYVLAHSIVEFVDNNNDKKHLTDLKKFVADIEKENVKRVGEIKKLLQQYIKENKIQLVETV